MEKRNWLKEESAFVADKSLKKTMLAFDQFSDSEADSDAFLILYKKVLDYYTHNQTDKVANDDMSNLVLLDYKTNRAYKNWSFARKRKFLFERDAEGRFIPFATKKAFNKQYTQEVCPVNGWQHLLMGGFLFGTVFMATDPVTATHTQSGKFIYGLLIGILAIVIRVINKGYPEGMMLAILLMNIFAPLIDYCVVKVKVKKRKLNISKHRIKL